MACACLIWGAGQGELRSFSRDFDIDDHGIDVVQPLLDYAKAHTPAKYDYWLVQQIQIPDNDASADTMCAFSLFTHLLHEETYRYLGECWRVLRPQGRLVFSFLEFAMPYHWHVFEGTVRESKMSARTHLNVFIERSAIQAWAEHLGFHIELWQDNSLGPCIPLSRPVVTDTGEKLEQGANLGQSVCVLIDDRERV
jgi:2-polyprenyl-3-methyl-5-hydroxy-6-metoxy-1,4-benzoquinol methylase